MSRTVCLGGCLAIRLTIIEPALPRQPPNSCDITTYVRLVDFEPQVSAVSASPTAGEPRRSRGVGVSSASSLDGRWRRNELAEARRVASQGVWVTVGIKVRDKLTLSACAVVNSTCWPGDASPMSIGGRSTGVEARLLV